MTPRHRRSRGERPPVAATAAKAISVSAAAGVLLAALALPVVGGAGLAAKSQADAFLVLPAVLEDAPVAQRTELLAADGSVIASLYAENRRSVPLVDVPRHVRDAVLAVEDARFYTHKGVDPKGTLRAAVANLRADDVTQGGSTLTQQYVKNALLQVAKTEQEEQAAREATLERKIREARYALALERRISKDEILERYLNIAYYGNGVYGIGTASAYYFGKPVQALTLAEGALLAGIVQSPSKHDPARDLAAAVARRDVVLQRMVDTGMLPAGELAAHRAEQPVLQLTPTGNGCEAPDVAAPFFCAHVRDVLEGEGVGAALGGSRHERQQRLLRGGLKIRTTLDPGLQAAAQAAADGKIPREDPSGIATAVNIVEPGTGAVRAMAVNRVYAEDGPGSTKVNLATGGSSGMQAGSAFKPFVLAEAVRAGIPLSTTINSPNTYSSPVFSDYRDGRERPYRMRNAGDSQSGTFDLRTGTHGSVNTFYVQLQERTGVEAPAALAEAMGVRQFADGAPSAPLLRSGSFVLGANEVSPLALAGAYAAFASRGLFCPPTAVTGIEDAAGQPLPFPQPGCRQVLDPAVADTVNDVLTGVIDGSSGARTGRAASIGRPAAGKTGTTNDSRAAWFAGYTPTVATTVWVGRPVPVDMERIRVAGRYYPSVYGGTIPARIWQATMRGAVAGTPRQTFHPPPRTSAAS